MTRTTARAALLAAVMCASGLELFHPRLASAAPLAGQINPVNPDDVEIRALLQRLEQAAQQMDGAAYLELLHTTADRKSAADFIADELRPGITRVVIQERERQNLRNIPPGTGYSLVVDAFFEYQDRARIATWRLDIRRADDESWRIAGLERLSSVENIYRLTLNATQQFDAKNFVVLAEDLELTLVEGTVFTVDTDQGTTGLILFGQGEMRFHPSPRTEIEQVRIFSGADTLESRFDAAYIRVGMFDAHADRSVLKPRAVDPRDLRRAERLFREESAKSFVIDLADLTRDTWSLLPGWDDFLAEIRTRRFGTLTYARSASEAEDISVFERRRHRNIAVYASKDKLASQGRFYNEDDLSPFDVLDYDIAVTSIPERHWIDGRATMRLRVRAPSLGQLNIRLADALVVRSVVSDRFGRLFHLRVSNQDTILVNLPVALTANAEVTLRIDYSGRLDPQTPDREALAVAQGDPTVLPEMIDPFFPKTEASYLYSNRSYWYPQSTISDYATATIQITVPAAFSCVASGEPASDSPRMVSGSDPSQATKVYTYTAERPLRYLAFLVSRLTRADRWTVVFDKKAPQLRFAKNSPDLSGAVYDKLDLIVETNPRQLGRGRDIAERAVDVFQFFESVVGDSPFSTFTLALVESVLPGGHSPGFFAALNQPLPNTGVTWRNDPAAFSNYAEFFLAHEIAHQWWGQAVGWRNYHEQWLSEGFAQYFAALYAQHFRGDAAFSDMMRQMRKWAVQESDQGPVYLGYRVGHIRNDGRAFRAVVYNKGAVVLHMLRQLVGDDVFFKGLRRFYAESRFTKVGTQDFQLAMEIESGRSLQRFFDRWIYNSALPKLMFSYRMEPSSTGQDVVLRFEQTGDVFDLPVTVTLQYADRKPVDVLVPVTDKIVEFRVPLQGTLRTVDVSRDEGIMAEIVKRIG